MEQKNESKSFEQALARLEEIVNILDSGSAPLDDSLALFEEGASLVRLCSGKLDRAQQRIKILTADPDGNMTEQDFTESEPEKK